MALYIEKRHDILAYAAIILLAMIIFIELSATTIDSGMASLTGRSVGNETADETTESKEEIIEQVKHNTKIKKEVIEDIEKKNNTEVIVVLKKTPELEQATARKDIEGQKQEIKKKQEEVLKKIEQDKAKSSLPLIPKSILKSTKHKENKDVELKTRYKTINAMSGNVTAEGLARLAEDPSVEKIIPQFKFSASLQESVPYIRADKLWEMDVQGENINGTGQVICVLDTGIDYTHEAFGGHAGFPNPKIIAGDDLYYGDGDPFDNAGHGTHVAGTIASEDPARPGVAPGAKIVAVQVCDDSGSNCNALLSGIDWCVNNASKLGIGMISISIGITGLYFDDLESCESASAGLFNLGDLFVAASAGNNGTSEGVTIPACLGNVTSVGAVNDSDSTIASFSNRGSLLDVMAPGVDIYAPLDNSNWGTRSGTSMAAPHAAGTAALLMQYSMLKNGQKLTRHELDRLLKRTYREVTDHSTGKTYPIIDVKRAVDSMSTIDSSEDIILHANGSINYTSDISLDNAQYCISFDDNLIKVRSSDPLCQDFDAEARVTLNNLGFDYIPAPYKDGVPCYSCTGFSYDNGNFSFNAAGFSNYTAGINSQLSIFDDNDAMIARNKTAMMNTNFFANYTNITSNASIDNSTANGWCNISFNTTPFGPFSMQYNSTTGLYQYNRTFPFAGNYTYNVTCNATSYTNLTLSDTISISENRKPEVNISCPQNQSIHENGTTITLNATASDYEDGILSGDNIVWASDPDGNFANGTSVSYNASNGTYRINVTATDSAGQNDTDSITIHFKHSPKVYIAEPNDGASYASGKTVYFKGNATDIEDGSITGNNLTWISSRNGIIGNGQNASATSLNTGTHTIALQATDSDGLQAEDSITVKIVSSGGSNNGGGGGSSTTNIGPSSATYTITSSSRSITIHTYDNLKIEVKGRLYSIKASGIAGSSAFLDVSGRSMQLFQDTTSMMDLDGDNAEDISIKLDSTSDNEAVVEIKELSLAASPPIEEEPEFETAKKEIDEEDEPAVEQGGVESIEQEEPEVQEPSSFPLVIVPIAIIIAVLLGITAFKIKGSSGEDIHAKRNMSTIMHYYMKYKGMGYSDDQIKDALKGFFTTKEIKKGVKKAAKSLRELKP